MSTSTKPTALSVIPDSIPIDLRAMACWLVWKYVEERDPETGEVDWDKPPLNARGGPGSSVNARTWSVFEVALAAYLTGKFDGLGFVLCVKPGDDGEVLIAVDLDHCRNPETGEIAPWAREIIDALSSYTEVSPSGQGIRIFLRGKLPPHGRKRGDFETYCTGRYVTVTGQHLDGTPTTIESREAELLAIHKRIWPEHHEPKQKTTASSGHAVDLTDLELIEKAKKSKHGDEFRALWEGGLDGNPSASEGDLALCNRLGWWTGYDPQRIDQLFRQSGRMRSKWNRSDYRERTLRKACEGKSGGYEPRRGRVVLGNHHSNGNGQHHEAKPHDELPQVKESKDDPPHLTDLGNAKRIFQRHGKDMRFCHDWRQYLIWDGRRFVVDDSGEAVRRAKDTQAALYRWAAEQLAELAKDAGDEDEDEERKAKAAKLTKILQHALKWEDARRINASLELLRSDVPIRPAEMDRDPWSLNVTNGTIDLRTGQLRPHQRDDLLTKLAPVAFDPAATCPLWDACLDKWMGANSDMSDYLRRVIGYALTGDVSEQVLFFLHGAGANGKSTFLNAIREMLGDYGCQAVSELLLAKNTESHPTERADLFGRRFVATIETDEGKRMAEALMKQLTGSDNVRARRMRQDFFDMTPTWKLFLAANHRPVIRGTDFAVWRRIRLIPFTVTIDERDKDKHLSAKLREQLPGILAWAVRGCLEWQRHGLADPEEVRQATEAYQREQDILGAFLAECCTVAEFAKVRSSALLKAYQEWSGDKVITPQTFRKRMNDKGFQSKDTSGRWYYHGVGLPAENDCFKSSFE